ATVVTPATPGRKPNTFAVDAIAVHGIRCWPPVLRLWTFPRSGSAAQRFFGIRPAGCPVSPARPAGFSDTITGNRPPLPPYRPSPLPEHTDIASGGSAPPTA